jgi:hypothetical protein
MGFAARLDSHFDNKVKRLDVDILPALKDQWSELKAPAP